MTTNTPPALDVQALIARAQSQTQANRYLFLRKAAEAKLTAQIVNS